MMNIGGIEMVILIVILLLIGMFALFGFRQFVAKTKEHSESKKEKNNISDDSEVNFNKLSELKKLLDNGILTQEEFDREKKKILK